MKSYYKSEEGKNIVLEAYREILSMWPVRNRQYHVETSQGSTFVIESGEEGNPPVILLHGSVSNSFAWFGDIERLSRKFHVFAVDLIGEAGFSDENRPVYESGAYALWLHDVMSSLQLESASFVGLSLGGWMALEHACTYPESVSGLFLLCPGGLYPSRADFLWKVLFYSLFGKCGKKQVMKLITGRTQLSVSSDEGLQRGLEFTALIGRNFKPRASTLPVFPREKLSRLTMPVQLLFGERDAVLHARKSIDALKSAVPQSETYLLPDAGHVLVGHTERIEEFLRRIEGKI